MAASLNQVQLIGNLGKDPDLKFLTDGKAVANVSIATSETWNDAQGNKQEKTEWHNISAFGKLAEIIGEWLKKGSKVFIQGKLTTRKWEKDGVTHYTTSIIADKMVMLCGGRARNEAADDGGAPGPQSAPQAACEEDLPF